MSFKVSCFAVMLNTLPHDEYGGDPDSFEIMANFLLPLLANTQYGHDSVNRVRQNFDKCEQDLLAELYLISNYLLNGD